MHFVRNADQGTKTVFDPPALPYERRTLTHGDFQAAVDRLAHGLTAGGMSSGDRLALFLPAMPELAVAYLAAQKLGVVVVFLSPTLTTAALRCALAENQVCVILTTATLLPRLQPLPTTTPHVPFVILCEGTVPGFPILDDLFTDRDAPFPTRHIAPSAPATVLYTPGVTDTTANTATTTPDAERPLTKVVRRYPSEPWYFDYGM